MGTYGRNFEFRVPPVHGQRMSRFKLADAVARPIGVPVVVADGAVPDALDLLPAALAVGAQPPKPGLSGILVYEVDPGASDGRDPVLYGWSDQDMAPAGKAIQVVSGDKVKPVFTNTVTHKYLGVREYTGRVMVAGIGATPSLQVGDFLTPGAGNDTDGYWAETATAANAWLRVERVNVTRRFVEARFVF